MSSKISIINCSNIYAINFLRNLKGYKKVILGDIDNSRRQFLHNFDKYRNENNDVEVNHCNINSSVMLEGAIKGSDTVLYFSHDYFSKVIDKNDQILQAAKLCKNLKVKKFVAVTPLEYVNFQTGSILENPLSDLNKSHDMVLDTFKNATIIKPDVVFGSKSYLVKYLAQSWAQSYSYIDSAPYKHYKFNPIYWKDLNNLIDKALTSNNSNGKRYLAQGKESLSFTEIDNLIKQAYCLSATHQDANKILKSMIEGFTLFYHGNNHIINFSKMIKSLQAVDPLNNNYEDIANFVDFDLKSFREYYSDKKNSTNDDENLNVPDYRSYWNNSLH